MYGLGSRSPSHTPDGGVRVARNPSRQRHCTPDLIAHTSGSQIQASTFKFLVAVAFCAQALIGVSEPMHLSRLVTRNVRALCKGPIQQNRPTWTKVGSLGCVCVMHTKPLLVSTRYSTGRATQGDVRGVVPRCDGVRGVASFAA